MATRILLSYESMPVHFFGDSYEFSYLLTLEVTSKFLWWTTVSVEQVIHTISMFQSLKKHHDHWDKLIKTKKQIE